MSARDYVTLIKGFRHVDVSTRFRFFSNVLNSLLYFFFYQKKHGGNSQSASVT